jgi:hypothetical protein
MRCGESGASVTMLAGMQAMAMDALGNAAAAANTKGPLMQ